METELWPNLVAQAKKQQIKLMIVNGRISAKSINQYQKLAWLITPCLEKFDVILSQSESNQHNFITLGAIPAACQISGNLKYDMMVSDDILVKKDYLQSLLPENKKLLIVASTHQGDEDIALIAFAQLKLQHPNLLLVIVPRHPERFSEVANLVNKYGLICQ